MKLSFAIMFGLCASLLQVQARAVIAASVDLHAIVLNRAPGDVQELHAQILASRKPQHTRDGHATSEHLYRGEVDSW